MHAVVEDARSGGPADRPPRGTAWSGRSSRRAATSSRIDLPHDAAAARIEAGRRLVQEDDPRVADEGHRQVESPAHAARIGRDGLLRGVDQVEPLEELVDAPAPLGAPRWRRSAISRRFSSPVNRPSTAENWPVTPMTARTASASRATSWPAICASPPSAAMQRRQDLDGRRLAGAVRAEQGEDRALGDVEVDAVEDDLLAVGLAQADGADGRSGARWPSCRTSRPNAAGASVRCRGPRRSAAGRTAGDHVVELRRDPLAEFLERLDHVEGRFGRRASVAGVPRCPR